MVFDARNSSKVFLLIDKEFYLRVNQNKNYEKIFFAAFAGFLCFFTSCNSNTGSTTGNSNDTQKQKNLAANELIIRAFETRDVSKVDSAVSENFLDHTDRGDMRGSDSLKQRLSGFMKI